MIVIIDYDLGNLGSIQNMISRIGYGSVVSKKREDIQTADKLILPGVGSFDKGMENIQKLQIDEVLRIAVIENKKPLLGICLGMQLLTNSSEEGNLPGLGYLNASVKKFKFDDTQNHLKIPHMGWNTIVVNGASKLLEGMPADCRFYFVHSYCVNCNQPENIIASTKYGINFVSAFQKDNIAGVQFHPEKSHKYGMKLLKNFLENF